MAEGLVNRYLSEQWQAYSAGTSASGSMHPLAVRSMAELDIDISDNISEPVEGYRELNPHLVITVCDNASQNCPVWLGEGSVVHLPFDDPTKVIGSDAAQMAACREVRDRMRDILLSYLREG